MRIIAHRGYHAHHLENTLPAIEAAMKLGVAGVEVDLQLAGDGSVVVIHDATTARLWGDPRPVSAHSAESLAALGQGDDRIPTLNEVLELSRTYDIPVILDQKTPEVALAALALLIHEGLEGKVAFCGELPGLLEVRRHSTRTEVYLNDEGLVTPDIRILAQLRPSAINPEYHGVSLGLVRSAQEFGLGVSCWTPNREKDLRAMAALGVDAVMTDEVKLALDLLS
ncbi:hypothetical protein BSZ39_00240 [Bowdeniella nasicola]|uniref:GP-PDE domain-containing protein n=1 Tax=Bowdeniella nasicola TaxID=208480 RepID=A0A1Q5Q648_9ACTO|nr:glycerophosphodiester phosphodiesterase [Bowdeniella nasicola]OKL55169.1 hypothetical protein BSZ39_00240 [Bowdeniella nasicola]